MSAKTQLPPAGEGWKSLDRDPPSGACTLQLLVEVTDGERVWRSTTGRLCSDNVPLWWRFPPKDEGSP